MTEDQLAGQQIHLRKKYTGEWKAFIVFFDQDISGSGRTAVEAILDLVVKVAIEFKPIFQPETK